MHYNVTVDTYENSNCSLYQNITLPNFLAAKDRVKNIFLTVLDLIYDALDIRFGNILGKLFFGRNSNEDSCFFI